MRFFRHVTILHGCAVGGGSITYANTLLRPPDRVWDMGTWPGLTDWKAEMPQHYDAASRMLGVIQNRILGPADDLLKRVADSIGVGHIRSTERIWRSSKIPQEARAEQRFPIRSSVARVRHEPRIGCGGCMLGCRHGAKNTLDLNYLYLAEKRGAHVFPETKVVDIKPPRATEGTKNDGSEGYEVHTIRSTAWLRRRPKRFSCRGIMISASALGSMELLFALKEKGSLPAISDALGKYVRTNSESLIGVRVPGTREDLSKGVAIGSGIYIDEHTHIEAVRYAAGSDSMALLTTILTGGRPGPLRILFWLRNLAAAALLHPLRTLRILQPFGWARECVILLCMQAIEGHIDMGWRRPWFWPFRKFLASRGMRVPAYIRQANEFAQHFARLTGGTAMSMLPEILFNVPGTARCLGGCVIADSPANGVVDYRHRVFGYKNMYICDGSVIGANLGVNPSLTITALAERAMSFVRSATEMDWDDAAEVMDRRASRSGVTPKASAAGDGE